MSRNNFLLILPVLLWLLLPAALSESEYLLPVESIRADEVEHRTVEAEVGTYERFVSMPAAEYRPLVAGLRFEGSDAKFVEYTVKRGGEVKAGDVLAVFSAVVDDVALAERRVELERLKRDYESGRRHRLDEMDQLAAQLPDAKKAHERELLALRIARAEAELKRYDYEQQLAMEDVEKAIAEIEKNAQMSTLVAPFDGVVTSTYYLHAGDRVPTGVTLITIESSRNFLLRVNNTQEDFRYGMEVKIEVGVGKEKIAFAGRVVGSDVQLPSSRKTGYAYIEIVGMTGEEINNALADWKGEKIVSATVSAAACRLENIVLVPRRAIRQTDKKYMVYKLEDGVVQHRYVNFVMQNSSYAWVVQGIEPGDTIIID